MNSIQARILKKLHFLWSYRVFSPVCLCRKINFESLCILSKMFICTVLPVSFQRMFIVGCVSVGRVACRPTLSFALAVCTEQTTFARFLSYLAAKFVQAV